MSRFEVVGARRQHPPSLKDLVCCSIQQQTRTEPTGLPLECISYLQDYEKRKFITVFFVADKQGTGIAFVRPGRKGGVCYEVTNMERVCIIFSFAGCEVKVDLPLCKLLDTLSLAFCDYYIFVRHGTSFSAMHTLEKEKRLEI